MWRANWLSMLGRWCFVNGMKYLLLLTSLFDLIYSNCNTCYLWYEINAVFDKAILLLFVPSFATNRHILLSLIVVGGVGEWQTTAAAAAVVTHINVTLT